MSSRCSGKADSSLLLFSELSLKCPLTVCVCVCVYQDSQSKQSGYSMHQLQGNKEFGSEKKGYLLKKSDGYDCLLHSPAQVLTGRLIG